MKTFLIFSLMTATAFAQSAPPCESVAGQAALAVWSLNTKIEMQYLYATAKAAGEGSYQVRVYSRQKGFRQGVPYLVKTQMAGERCLVTQVTAL